MPLLALHHFLSPGLEPIDLELAAGSCVTLSGPSGCGKSRLLRAISDLDPAEGEIRLEGVSRSTIDPPQWRRQVGYLAAESAWWAHQVGDHFPESTPSLSASLERIDLPEAALNWEVERLSSGERQRLALIRLLANQPKVLLLDEPTANLDQKSTQLVEALLAAYRDTTQAVLWWVSHDPVQRQRVADRRLQIVQGRLEKEPWN